MKMTSHHDPAAFDRKCFRLAVLDRTGSGRVRGCLQQRGHAQSPVAALGGNQASPLSGRDAPWPSYRFCQWRGLVSQNHFTQARTTVAYVSASQCWSVRCGADMVSASWSHRCWTKARYSGHCRTRSLRQSYITPHCVKSPASQSRRSFVSGHRFAPFRFTQRDVMQNCLRWFGLVSGRHSPFAVAPYMPPTVALVALDRPWHILVLRKCCAQAIASLWLLFSPAHPLSSCFALRPAGSPSAPTWGLPLPQAVSCVAIQCSKPPVSGSLGSTAATRLSRLAPGWCAFRFHWTGRVRALGLGNYSHVCWVRACRS
jgi:hypothetical protein